VVVVVWVVACIGSILYRVCVEVVLYFQIKFRKFDGSEKGNAPNPKAFPL